MRVAESVLAAHHADHLESLQWGRNMRVAEREPEYYDYFVPELSFNGAAT